jgi:hypothetical protein
MAKRGKGRQKARKSTARAPPSVRCARPARRLEAQGGSQAQAAPAQGSCQGRPCRPPLWVWHAAAAGRQRHGDEWAQLAMRFIRLHRGQRRHLIDRFKYYGPGAHDKWRVITTPTRASSATTPTCRPAWSCASRRSVLVPPSWSRADPDLHAGNPQQPTPGWAFAAAGPLGAGRAGFGRALARYTRPLNTCTRPRPGVEFHGRKRHPSRLRPLHVRPVGRGGLPAQVCVDWLR